MAHISHSSSSSNNNNNNNNNNNCYRTYIDCMISTAMKCLSVSQPFAQLIITGKKTIELRKWNTKFRGEFLVHAPQKIRTDDCRRLRMDAETLATGAIIGKAEIYDVKTYQSPDQIKAEQSMHHAGSGFGSNRYGFLLCGHKAFRVPIPLKGRLGFFEASLPKITHRGDESLVSDIIDEEYRYGLIGHH